MKAVLVISHGSRSGKTVAEVRALTKELKSRSGLAIIDYAFLEIVSPSIPEGIKNCVEKGANDITILLNFLNAGKHVDEDIPRIVKEARNHYPHVTIKLTKPIGQHKEIADLFLDLI